MDYLKLPRLFKANTNVFSYKINLNRFERFYFRVVMFIFNITGVAPFQMAISRSKKPNKTHTLKFSYSLIGSVYSFLLSFILFHTIYSLNSRKKKYEGFSYVEEIIRLTLTMCHTAGVMNLSLRYSFQQRTILDIISNLLYIENKIKTKFNRNLKFEYVSHTFILIFFLSINVAIAGIEFYDIGKFQANIIIHSIPWFIMSSAIIQYTFMVISIEQKFQNLNQLLLLLTDSEPKSLNKFICVTKTLLDRIVLDDILFVQQTHRNLYKLIDVIANYYASIILLPILQCCLGTTYNVFGLISKIKLLSSNAELIRWIMSLLWTVRYLFPIVILSGYVNKMIFQMKKTGEIIHEILDINFMNMGVVEQLRQFSIELLHRNPRVSVYGLFSLSSSLITSMTGMILTYMIILIQVRDSFLEQKKME